MLLPWLDERGRSVRRIIVAFGSAVLALVVTTIAVWSFLVPPAVRDGFITIISCLCMPPRWQPANSEALLEAKGWVSIDNGHFHIYGPPGSQIHPTNARRGRIVMPGYILRYELGAPGFPAAGQDVVDEPVRVDGARAILRRAFLPGADEPYFAGLYVPQAKGRDGQPVALLIYGVFRNRGERAVADSMLATVGFGPVPTAEGLRQPARPRAEPPVFDIAPDPA